MSLRDVELDVTLLLEAAGLGSTSSNPPTLFAGPFPASAPDALIACRHSGAEKPEKYLANTGLALHRETVTVLVRGTRKPGSYVTDGARARTAWSALFDLHPDEYELVDPEDGAPRYLGEDEEQRPRWSFTVELEYLSATAPGVVVPLSRDATLRVGGLSVAGAASVGGLLGLACLPFASFPAPEAHRGALAFDTDAGQLRVSTGAAWVAVGASPSKHSGPLEVVDVAEGETALRIPAGARLAFTADGGRYIHYDPLTHYITSSGFFRAPLFLAGEGLGPEEAAFGVDARAWGVMRNGRVFRRYVDTTGTVGDAAGTGFRGRALVAAGQDSVTISNPLCLPTSDVRAHVQQAAADASGAFIVRTSAEEGALTIYLNTPPAAPLVVAWELID